MMSESSPSLGSPAPTPAPEAVATECPPPSPSTTAAAAATAKKTVYLIRHANSVENQRIASMFSCLGDLGRFSLPKKSDVSASFGLLNIKENADAPISELGLQQCDAMKVLLSETDFLRSEKIQMVAHSPLQRAKQTCQVLFGCSSDHVVVNTTTATSGAAGSPAKTTTEPASPAKVATPATTSSSSNGEPQDSTGTASPPKQESSSSSSAETENPPLLLLPEPVQRVVNLELLTEKTHLEWIPGNSGSFEQRVADFQHWLSQQPESILCVVGHSQFFKTLLGLSFKLENCDVHKVTFEAQKETPNEAVILEHDGTADLVTLKPQWYDLELIHTCNKKEQRQPKTTRTTSKQAPNDDHDDI